MNKDKLTVVANKAAGYVKQGGAIVVPILVAIAFDKGRDYILDRVTIGCINDYDDAVKVILDSNMYSSAKQEAIQLLKIDEDAVYYRTIARIVLSSTYSSAKIDMIEDINAKKIEES